MLRRVDLRGSTLAALAERDFRLLWGGLLVSNIGTQMQNFAVAWLVIEVVRRDGVVNLTPLYLGIVAAAAGVPRLLVGLFAGTIADRTDRRQLLIWTQSAAAVVAAIFAVLVLNGKANLPLIAAFSALTATTGSFEPSARQAMVPRLVPAHRLASAVGLTQVTQTGAVLVGPLLAGLLIGLVGVSGLLLCNAVSFGAFIAALIGLHTATPPSQIQRPGVLESVREGFSYIWGDRVIRPLFSLFAVVSIAGWPFQQLLPAFAEGQLAVGALELSWLFAAGGLGALAGAVTTASVRTAHRGKLLVGSVAFAGFAMLLFGFDHVLLTSLCLAAAVMFAIQLNVGLHVTTYQERSPDALQGRVVAVSSTLAGSLLSLGSLLLGLLATVVGIGPALALAGVLLVAASLLTFLFVEPLRDLGSESRVFSTPATQIPESRMRTP